MAESRLLVFQGEIHGEDKMDVGFVAGVHGTAGDAERKKLVRGELQLLKDEKTEG
jgi:hypothetical protein